MAECGKRPRGRPMRRCLDDAATPARLAGPDPGVVRRLQRKFRDDQPALMEHRAHAGAHGRHIAVTAARHGAPAGAETAADRGLWPDAAVGR